MSSEVALALCTIGASVIGSWAVMKWRMDRADTDRNESSRKYSEDKERLWAAIHDTEKAASAHEKEAYEERLKIAEKFNAVTIVNANLAAEVKIAAATISRVEQKIDALSQEVKRHEED